MQQQPDTLALPGFVFDPTRNRYFRAVKGTLGNPAEIARPVKKKRLPIILKVSSKGASSGGSSGIGSSTSVASIPPNNAAVVSAQETVRRGIASRAKGLHAFAMNSRRGIWGTAGTLASPGACVRRAIAGEHGGVMITLRRCFLKGRIHVHDVIFSIFVSSSFLSDFVSSRANVGLSRYFIFSRPVSVLAMTLALNNPPSPSPHPEHTDDIS